MKKSISIILCIIILLSAFPFCAFAATAISFDINPSVFLCGDIYNVVWANNVAGIGYVTYEIDGVTYTVYDEEGGIVRTDDYAHTVSVPVDELDAAGGYKVHAVAVDSRTPYGIAKGNSCETYREFHGYENQDEINIWTVSDTHLTLSNFTSMANYIKTAASNLKGGSPDMVMLLGDIANDVPSKAQALKGVFGIAEVLSGGKVPCVYTRGNHETRGEFSGYFLQYFPSDFGEFYFTFDYGPMSSVVLDFGEDKFDDHREYSGLVNYDNYREKQTEWLTSLDGYGDEDTVYRISFCHSPNVNNHFGYNWTRELERMGTDLMVAGHTHKLTMHLEDHPYYEGFPIMIDGHHTNSNKGFNISQLLLKDGNIECYGTSDTGGDLLSHNITAGNNPPEEHYPTIGGDDHENDIEPTAISATNGASGVVSSEIKGAPDFAIVTKPTVFDTGDTYTVAWATTPGKNSSGEVYVEYNGERKRFSDDESGTLRCLSNVHAVKIPKKYLEGSRYEIISRHVKKHGQYHNSCSFGNTVSTGYIQFEGYSGQDEIRFAVLSDMMSDKSAYYKMAELGIDYDMLIITGNSLINAQTSTDVINGLLVNTGYLTGGKKPVTFARGVSETKGEYAPYLSWIVRNSTRQFYEKVSYGPVTLAVLDSSGLVADTDPETLGLSCFASVRDKQQRWLDAFDYGDATYKLALTNTPRLDSLVGHNFARSLNDLGTDMLIASGGGVSEIDPLGTKNQNYLTVKNGNLYTDGTVATLITFKDGVITTQVVTDTDSTQTSQTAVTYNDTTLFSDTEQSGWYADAVGYVSRQHLMVGVGNDSFAPNDTLTRADAAVILARLENAQLDSVDPACFTDVDKNAYYAKAVAWAKNNGIVFGVGDNKFTPNAQVTREQLSAMLVRLYGNVIKELKTVNNNTVDMTDVSYYAKDAVSLLYKKGILCGRLDGICPNDNITRAETAQILYKAKLNVQVTYNSIGQ